MNRQRCCHASLQKSAEARSKQQPLPEKTSGVLIWKVNDRMELTPVTEVGNNGEKISAADRVMITYYTDPLCCWSWALEPHWRKLASQYQDAIQWRYVMGGMIQDWNTYNDPLNSVSRPLQLGPVWMHASQVSGTPMDYSIWHKDPPSSSFPSCIAVKCAGIQSGAAADLLLSALRVAVMTKGENISKELVIMSIANNVAQENPLIFDIKKFEESWRDGSGVNAFRDDLKQTRFLKIGRFPTLTFTNASSKGIMITGYRPFEVMKEALQQMLPGASKKQNPS